MFLYLDIETVPNYHYEWYNESQQIEIGNFISKKIDSNDVNNCTEYLTAEWWLNPIFGKICCISCGKFNKNTGQPEFKSFYWYNEKELLQNFVDFINGTEQIFVEKKQTLDIIYVGHNIIDFDIPFIVKRLLINSIKVPKSLVMYWKKSWDLNVQDTMLMFESGRGKKISLSMLSVCLGFENPKDNCDWSSVSDMYYHWNNLNDIVEYCEGDVSATIKVHRKMRELYWL